jgi:putative hemolysin
MPGTSGCDHFFVTIDIVFSIAGVAARLAAIKRAAVAAGYAGRPSFFLSAVADILIILALIVLNGLFATAELSIASAKKLRLEQAAQQGSEGARVALDLAADPSDFLSTIQIGITLIGIFNGAFGEASLSVRLAPLLASLPGLAPYAAQLALACVIAGITLASILFGELLPKRLAMQYPETIAAVLARPLRRLSRLMAPLVSLLSGTTDLILKLIGVHGKPDAAPTTQEISGMLREGSDAGVLDKVEYDIARRALGLREQPASALMTARVDLTYIDVQAERGRNLAIIAERPYGRFPVVDGDPARVLGVVHAGELFGQAIRAGSLDAVDIAAAVRQPLQVPGSATAMGLLQLFRAQRAELALVVDEHGQLLGMVTLTDLMGAVVGGLPGIEAREADAVQREDGSWLLDGAIDLERLRELLGTQAPWPGEAGRSYQSLAGFLLHQFGRVPSPSEHIEWNGYRFEVVDMDRNRIDRVLISPV